MALGVYRPFDTRSYEEYIESMSGPLLPLKFCGRLSRYRCNGDVSTAPTLLSNGYRSNCRTTFVDRSLPPFTPERITIRRTASTWSARARPPGIEVNAAQKAAINRGFHV